uniref:Zona-pellucida-binding protein 1/2 N-terminal domain-containing protein n=1 Tax=Crocodylus porosus TaxID=8502 RepID=A0A7M4F652_CROPO
MQRIIDPKYQWIGPMGLITKESQRFLLTDEGNLEVYNIHASDSGSYTCSVIYMHNDRHVIAEFSFMVYVYHKPGKSIHLSSEFKTETCETSAVVPFEKQLLEHLEKLMRNLQCEIQQWNTQCHAATDTVAMLTHKLIFQFVVFPLTLAFADPCRSSECENFNSIKKAYARIKQFFESQNIVQHHSQQIHYISGSLSGIKMDHCKPGFGKNINNSTMCPGCCGILQIWIVFLISCIGTTLILVISWIIIQKCCRRTLAAQFIKETEPELKHRLKTFANIANDAEIEKQRSKLRNSGKHVKKNLPKYKAGFLHEESTGLLSNDGMTETSTPAASNPSPDRTWPSEVETSFEERHRVPKGLPPNRQMLAKILSHKAS